MNCPYCDGYNVNGAKYCRICGKRLDKYQRDNNSSYSSIRDKKKKTVPEWVNNCCVIIGAIVALILSFFIVDSLGWLYKEVGFGPNAHDEVSKNGIMLMLLLAYGLWYALGFLCVVILDKLGYK